jgi:hypothetical protein
MSLNILQASERSYKSLIKNLNFSLGTSRTRATIA